MSESTSNILINVVIPCYNKQSTVARAINSVRAQTLTNFTCVVVNNNSTDNSDATIKETLLANNDNRFTYVNCPVQGVAHARNYGIAMGTAPFICCLDADDQILPQFLEACIEPLQKDKSLGITYTKLQWVKPDNTTGVSTWPGEFDALNHMHGKNQIPTCCLFRRLMWERIGGYRQRFADPTLGCGAEDGAAWLHAVALGWGAKLATEAPLFVYSMYSGAVSGNKNYREQDYKAWFPYCQDERWNFACQVEPKHFSHAVHSYAIPSVSIIVPVGPGHEQLVVDALDSVEAQSERGWECVVVWDSPDTSNIDKLKTAYPFIKLVYTDSPPKGAGYARNRGVDASKAPALLFLDADDYLMSNCLQVMIDAYAQDKAVIYSDYIGLSYYDNKQMLTKYSHRVLDYNEKTKQAVITYQAHDYDCQAAQSQPASPLYHWNLVTCLVPKEWHMAIGGYDESMPSWEDWLYSIQLARRGYCFVRVAEPLVVYRFYTGNRREDGIQLHKELFEYLEQIKQKDKINTMPCSSCGKSRSASKAPAVQRGTVNNMMRAQPNQQNNIQATVVNDSDFILCLYDHPNRGGHRVIGPFMFSNRIEGINMITVEGGYRIDYRYRNGGTRFYVHKADQQVAQRLYIPIETAKPKVEEPTQPVTPMPAPNIVAKVVGGMVIDDSATTMSDNNDSVSTNDDNDAQKPFDLQTLPGVTGEMAMQLNAMGVHTPEDVLKIGVEGLVELKGIGQKRAEIIIEYIKQSKK